MQKASRSQAKAVPFSKLHGAGNDILVVFRKDLPKTGKAAFLKRMAHRQFGVGCDQIVEVLSLKPLAIQIWNQDGTKAEMCANGTRVFLFLAAQEGWISDKAAKIPLEISGAPYVGFKTKAGYELCLGAPRVEGFDRIELSGSSSIPFHEVSVGNPHAVILCGDGRGQWPLPKDFDYKVYGPRLETHPRFPRKTNVEFVRGWKVKGKKAEVFVEVWERGAGATYSCGSGAVAVAAVIKQLFGATQVELAMTEFKLLVRFEGDKAFLSGPCTLVAKGQYFNR